MGNWLEYLRAARLWIAQYRVPMTKGVTALGAFALALFFQPPQSSPPWLKWASLGAFIVLHSFAIFLSTVPQYSERVRYATILLPAIYDSLGVDPTTRVTIHHIRSTSKQIYEQITPYYPTSTGQGRRFVFTQGITGQAFRTRRSHIYIIPADTLLQEDYLTRWSFTDDEIGRLTQDRRSFYAYPIGQEGGFAKAVLYFDSADSKTFTANRKNDLDDKIARLFLPILETLIGTDSPRKPA